MDRDVMKVMDTSLSQNWNPKLIKSEKIKDI